MPKILEVTGLAKEWNQKKQSFDENSVENIQKNTELLEAKKRYLQVAQDWEREGRSWSPIQWAHCLKQRKWLQKKKSPKKRLKSYLYCTFLPTGTIQKLKKEEESNVLGKELTQHLKKLLKN